jgi:hypothetical protein
LKHYELVDHVLYDAPPINDLACDRMETIILFWIFGMITGELEDIAKEHDIAAHQIWCMIEHQFIGNSEMCALHLDAMFRNFIQGDLLVSGSATVKCMQFISTPRSATSSRVTSQ